MSCKYLFQHNVCIIWSVLYVSEDVICTVVCISFDMFCMNHLHLCIHISFNLLCAYLKISFALSCTYHMYYSVYIFWTVLCILFAQCYWYHFNFVLFICISILTILQLYKKTILCIMINIYYYNSNLIWSAGSRQIVRHGSLDQRRHRASSLI